MTYTNITGVNVGNCLTGFGIHFPVTVINDGNSEVLYSFAVTNSTNFSLSSSSVSLYPSNSGVFDIFYKPTIEGLAQDEISDITINSVSVEDNSLDPSGVITIKATGRSIINITGGNPRSFRVVGSFSANDGPKFNFYWKHPTGITGDNLHNYFITGYNLQLSSDSDFDPLLYTKEINISSNTNLNPKYASYYGFNDEDIFTSITKNDLSSLALDTPYYARLYTCTVNNTGVSVYASGVNSKTDGLPSEIAVGYSGTPVAIKIEKQPLNVYIEANQYTSMYDLDSKILSLVGSSADMSFYSGINIYLPENSIFRSDNTALPAIKLDGVYLNFTGSTTLLPNNDTVVNIYVPTSTVIAGQHGKGGKVKFNNNIQTNKAQGNFTWEYYNFTQDITTQQNNTTQAYNNTNQKEIYDTSNGGPAISLKLQSNNQIQGIRKDIKYKIHSQVGSRIYSGGGGTKAGIHIVGGNGASSFQFLGFQSSDTQDNSMYPMYFPVNGNLSNNNLYINWNVYYRNNFGGSIKSSTVSSAFPYWGEVGFNKSIFLNRKADLNKETNEYLFSTVINSAPPSLGVDFYGDQISNYRYEFLPINNLTENRQPGYLVESLSESYVKLFIANSSFIPTDYIFRFANNGLNSATNWTGGTSASPSLYTLSSTNAGDYVSNFESLSYKALRLKQNKDIHIDFSSSINKNCKNFDVFFVCAFDSITLNQGTNTVAKLFDWTLTSSATNTVKNQISVFRLTENQTTYTSKDDLIFDFKLLPLVNQKDESSMTNFAFTGIATKDIQKISKPLSGSGSFRPFIINISRYSDTYYIYVNGILLKTTNSLGGPSNILSSTANLITNLNSTTFKLINSSSFYINYFDILFYSRTITASERQQVNNYLTNSYLNLFAGSLVTELDLKSNAYVYKLPNIFNLAGKS
jgi:hypothetical protein